MSNYFSENVFFFDADVSAPLVLKKFELRSELEYDKDVCAEKTALKYIDRISKCFDGHIYLVTASQDVAPVNKIRSKMGVLWNAKELSDLDHRNSEIQVVGGSTRLISLVDLDGFSYDTSETLVLNYIVSFVLLTKVNIDDLVIFLGRWVNKEHGSILAFNYDAVAKDLFKLNTTAVLRYFPADNGRNEALVLVGNGEYIENSVENCIRTII